MSLRINEGKKLAVKGMRQFSTNTLSQTQLTACFCKWSSIGKQQHPFVYELSMADCVLQWQSCIVGIEETINSPNKKYLSSDPLQEKFGYPCLEYEKTLGLLVNAVERLAARPEVFFEFFQSELMIWNLTSASPSRYISPMVDLWIKNYPIISCKNLWPEWLGNLVENSLLMQISRW